MTSSDRAHLAVAIAVLLSPSVGLAQDTPRTQAAFTELLSHETAWSRLALEGPDAGKRLPNWALGLAGPLPATTSQMLVLDRMQRTGEELDRLLRARIRWVAADANRCEYSRAVAEFDLRAAGADDAAIARLQTGIDETMSDAAVLRFSRKLTLAADTVTDEEVATLVEEYGEEQLVAVVQLLAWANFQDRLLLALGIPMEDEGPVAPLNVRTGPRPPRVELPDRDLPPGPTAEPPTTMEDPAWRELDFDDLQSRLTAQQNRTARVRIPQTRRGVRWSTLCLVYQPELARQWFQCMGTFHRESRQDRVFEESVFWVVTRTIHCFY